MITSGTTLSVVSAIIFCASGAFASPHPAAATAINLGLTPEAMAHAGLNSSDAAALLGRLDGAEQEVTAWQSASAALGAVNADLGSLVAASAEGDMSSEILEDIATAKAAAESARASVSTAVAALCVVAFDELDSGEVERLQAFIASADRRVPEAFRVLSMTADEWTAVERALIEEARSIRLDQSLSTESSELLAGLRGENAVEAAVSDAASNVESIDAVFTGVS